MRTRQSLAAFLVGVFLLGAWPAAIVSQDTTLAQHLEDGARTVAVKDAAAPTVTLPVEIRGSVGAWIIVAPELVDGGKPRWRFDDGLQEVRLDLLFPTDLVSQAKGKVFTAAAAGRFKVEAWNAKGDVASDITTCWIVVGSPTPVVVIPPGPITPLPPGPVVPPVVTPDTKILQAVYVYEKDTHQVPSGVMAGLNQLNRDRKIVATAYEFNTKTGAGDVPVQYKVSRAKAAELGLPVLVVTFGAPPNDTVLHFVKAPTTKEQIVKAVP